MESTTVFQITQQDEVGVQENVGHLLNGYDLCFLQMKGEIEYLKEQNKKLIERLK